MSVGNVSANSVFITPAMVSSLAIPAVTPSGQPVVFHLERHGAIVRPLNYPTPDQMRARHGNPKKSDGGNGGAVAAGVAMGAGITAAVATVLWMVAGRRSRFPRVGGGLRPGLQSRQRNEPQVTGHAEYQHESAESHHGLSDPHLDSTQPRRDAKAAADEKATSTASRSADQSSASKRHGAGSGSTRRPVSDSAVQRPRGQMPRSASEPLPSRSQESVRQSRRMAGSVAGQQAQGQQPAAGGTVGSRDVRSEASNTHNAAGALRHDEALARAEQRGREEGRLDADEPSINPYFAAAEIIDESKFEEAAAAQAAQSGESLHHAASARYAASEHHFGSHDDPLQSHHTGSHSDRDWTEIHHQDATGFMHHQDETLGQTLDDFGLQGSDLNDSGDL